MAASGLLDSVSLRAVERTTGSRGEDQALAAAELARAARAVASGLALEPVLGALAAGAVRALAARRCAIYLRDPLSGDLVLRAAHEAYTEDPELEYTAPGRIPAGTVALERVLRDHERLEVLTIPLGSSRQTPAIHLHPSLVAPIPVGANCSGIVLLDPAGRRQLRDDVAHANLRAFAALAGAAVLTASAEGRVDRQDAAAPALRANDQRRIIGVEGELLRLGLAAPAPADVARLVATRLGLPCAVLVNPNPPVAFDAAGQPSQRQSLLDADTLERRDVAADLAAVRSERPRTLGPYPKLGLHDRLLVARVPRADTDALIALSETGRSLTRSDAKVIWRAAAVLAIELRARRRVADADRHAHESIVRDAVQGGDSLASLRRRAASAGLDLDAAHVVCLISLRPDAPTRDAAQSQDQLEVDELQHAAAALRWTHARNLAATRSGVVAICPLDTSKPRHAAIDVVCEETLRLVEAVRWRGRPVIAAISSVCRSAGDLPGALAECEEVRSLLPGLSASDSGSPVLCADDLGVGRLILGKLSATDAERFITDSFGRLAEDEDGVKLLATLDAFLAANHSVRAAATRLGVHENTVRSRFRRLAEATGFDVVGCADDKLTASLALTLLKHRSNIHITKEHP